VTATSDVSAPLGTIITATATCPPGTKILGGGISGAVSIANQQSRVAARANFPSGPDQWTGAAIVTSGLVGATASINVYAVCTV
jgi:hypothetical protein